MPFIQRARFESSVDTNNGTATFDDPVANGSVLVARVHSSGLITTPGDYTELKAALDNFATKIMAKVADGTEDDLAISVSAPAILVFTVEEWSGLYFPNDQEGVTTQGATSSNAITVTAEGATSYADEVVFMCAGGPGPSHGNGDAGALASLSDSFTTDLDQVTTGGASGNGRLATGHKVLTATGTPACTATFSSSASPYHMNALLASFRVQASGWDWTSEVGIG